MAFDPIRRRGQVLANSTRRVQVGKMVPWGKDNQFVGVPKALQRRNIGVPAAASVTPPPDLLGGRFRYGENNNKIIDTKAGVYTPEQARQYQLLYNWAQRNGTNIVGQSGDGGGYDPTILYAQPGRYVDMRTGLANPPGTGASTDSAAGVSPEVLARLRKNAGFDPAKINPNNTAAAIGMGPAGLSHWQLGSDGQYHDVNAPLPPGVTMEPPEGATAPITQGVDQVAEAGHATPQAALAAGKDPTKHIAYWEDKGWTYNPATDQWTNRNAGQTPPINPGVVPGTTPGTPAPGTAAPGSGQMPLDPAYIAAQRAAQSQLNTTLGATNPALEQINAQNQLALARMNTNEGVDKQALMESLASRGALQSSIYGDNLGNLATNYLRQGQDLATSVANAYSDVYNQQSQAYTDYNQALIEALLSSGQSTSTSSYTPVGNTRRAQTKPKKRKRGRNRG